MKKERFVIEIVYQKLSKCSGCCNKCPAKMLAQYITEQGIDKFYDKYISGELPEEIWLILERKINELNL